MFTRQYPPKPVPMGHGSRRTRKSWSRHVISIRCIFGLVFVGFVFLGFWIGHPKSLDESPWLVGGAAAAQGRGPDPVPVKPETDEFRPFDDLTVDDVIDPVPIESLNSTNAAYYVICDGRHVIQYVQYLSLASVTRFFNPSHVVFLFETEPPTVLPGNWTTLSRLDDVIRKCRSRLVAHRMRNASLVCRRDVTKMEEFVMKLLFRFGGLYVGTRTFVTEMASFMRPGIIDEHVLWHFADDLEGFAYVRAPLGTADLAAGNNTGGPPLHPADGAASPSSPGRQVPIRYITSRQLHCLESPGMTREALYTNAGLVRHACLVIRDRVRGVDPWTVVEMRSDFGKFMRKAVFNIYNEQETQFYMRATNTSATPPLCSIV